MAEEVVWVWLDSEFDRQHLAAPPDTVAMSWKAATSCGLGGEAQRVTFENVDRGIACGDCTAAPYVLAGDDRGPP